MRGDTICFRRGGSARKYITRARDSSSLFFRSFHCQVQATFRVPCTWHTNLRLSKESAWKGRQPVL